MTVQIDDATLQDILDRIKALETAKLESDRIIEKTKQDVAQALRETGSIRDKVGGFY